MNAIGIAMSFPSIAPMNGLSTKRIAGTECDLAELRQFWNMIASASGGEGAWAEDKNLSTQGNRQVYNPFLVMLRKH